MPSKYRERGQPHGDYFRNEQPARTSAVLSNKLAPIASAVFSRDAAIDAMVNARDELRDLLTYLEGPKFTGRAAVPVDRAELVNRLRSIKGKLAGW